MLSTLVASSGGPGAPPLAEDLETAGIAVARLGQQDNLVEGVIKVAPDLVILFNERPDAALFEGTRALNATAPRPVVLFTTDPDADTISRAMESSVHAYIVNGYSPARLRSVIHLAQARFRHERLLREELADVNQRFAERKLVDRAKGILMGARRLREDEAYRALRTAAMRTKQRIGQVSQQVIDSARYAESINRAGQLRMLSQRLVKLYALRYAAVRPGETEGLYADSIGQTDSNLAILARSLSRATFGDLLDAVTGPWADLRRVLDAPPAASRLPELDVLAERVLMRAEQLTDNLEIAGFAPALRVVNVAGRQRMLSQRLAKLALMGADHGAVEAELADGLDYLATLPMSNALITAEVAVAAESWGAFRAALPEPAGPGRDNAIARESETLLASFERLTDELERVVQALIG